jgi:hypothetical protein
MFGPPETWPGNASNQRKDRATGKHSQDAAKNCGNVKELLIILSVSSFGYRITAIQAGRTSHS